MGSKLRLLCGLLGAALIVSALLLFRENREESLSAGKQAEVILEQMASLLPATDCPVFQALEEDSSNTLIVDGNEYIGTVRLVPFDLTLPVMADWSYPDLKIAPCRYSGSVTSDDLVIMAHNYNAHFGSLIKLTQGDLIEFTDATGEIHRYRVETVEVLQPFEIGEMTAGTYALTLFTCTYGGENRVTVRCSRLF